MTQDRAALEAAEKALRRTVTDALAWSKARNQPWWTESEIAVCADLAPQDAAHIEACDPAAMALILAELDRLRAQVATAAADEREACARVCEAYAREAQEQARRSNARLAEMIHVRAMAAGESAKRIRART